MKIVKIIEEAVEEVEVGLALLVFMNTFHEYLMIQHLQLIMLFYPSIN
jgi:hypothetical protein